jgi:uncharacterized protein YdaU (DUF1376 family)
MPEFPYMPLYVDDYLSATHELSTLEHGAYLLLLFAAWKRPGCDLPDDDAKLARVAKQPLGVWTKRLRPVLAEFFAIEDGLWRQKRQGEIRAHVAEVSEKRRQAAKASHESRTSGPPAGRSGDGSPAKPLNRRANGPANAPPFAPKAQKENLEKKTVLAAASGEPPTHAPTREETAPAEPAAAADASLLIILKTGWDEPEAAAAWATLLRFAGGDEDLAYYGLHRALSKGRDLLAYAGKVILAELAERARPAAPPAPYVDVLAEAKRMAAEEGTIH